MKPFSSSDLSETQQGIPVLQSIDDLDKERGYEVIKYPEDSGIRSIDVFRHILIPIEDVANKKGEHMSAAIKFHEDVKHEQPDGREVCLWMPPSCIATNLKQGVILGVSGVFRVEQDLYFIPTLDLEYPYQNTRFADLAITELAELGLTGYIIRSGYSHHFIGDAVFKYEPNFWKILGLFMKELTYDEDIFPEEVALSKHFGERIMQANSYEECLPIAQDIRKAYPTMPTGQMRNGLLYDPKWIMYKLIPQQIEISSLGINPLRVTKGKGYTECPVLDLQIRKK